MPSTYSPDLRIELIPNGDQSGTWGDTTNLNLGTIIEDAISGLAQVTVSTANQALIALNGAPDQARCAVVQLTSLLNTDFNIYVPPTTKTYVFVNSSGYTATVYCSTVLGNTTAAGAGVAVPASKSVLLRTDGTNVFEQLNHISGSFSTSGNVAVGGTLTATSPVFSGDPTAPTQATSDNSTKLATTAFVKSIAGTLGTAASQNVGLAVNNVVQRDANNSVPIGPTWSVKEVDGVLYFAVSGANKAKLDASGNLTVVGNVVAYGTV